MLVRSLSIHFGFWGDVMHKPAVIGSADLSGNQATSWGFTTRIFTKEKL